MLFATRLLVPWLPWPYVAASLALVGALLTLLAEQKRAFGDDYDSPDERDEPAKVSARRLARHAMAVALALVLFSAVVPVMELPRSDDVLRIGDKAGEVTFLDANGKHRLNPAALNSTLNDMSADIKGLAAVIKDVAGRDLAANLLVKNCGSAKECGCPDGYKPVPDSGGWNLNDKTLGSTIRLCSKAAAPQR